MWGGPPHTDTFDPKPEAGSDYTGPLTGALETNVKGIRIGTLLPELAKLADKYSIIRSMTHGVFGHETASYMVQTGRMAGGRLVYPAVGAVVTAFKGFVEGSEGLIPPYIVLTEPQGRFSEAGFMGIRYKPFATGGDPNAYRFAVEGIVAPGISDDQQRQRRELAPADQHARPIPGRRSADGGRQTGQGQGVRPDLGRRGQGLRSVRREGGTPAPLRPQHVRAILPGRPPADREGREVRHDQLQRLGHAQGPFPDHAPETPGNGQRHGHADCGSGGSRAVGQHDRVVGRRIRPHAASRLEIALEWRTPSLRSVFSTVVAGGGFKGGQVVGSSTAKGEQVKDRPVYPCDLIATMYELLGIDPEAGLPHPMGEFVRAVPGADEGLKMGGRLKEII